MQNYLPASLVSRTSKRLVLLALIASSWNLATKSRQTHEEEIEHMKVQFAAISEQKAEVERKLEPLAADEAKLKREMAEFDARKTHHAVSTSIHLHSLPYHRILTQR